MQRKLVTKDELSAILTAEIRSIAGVEDVSISIQYQLQEDDESGCNWATNYVPNLGLQVSSDTLIPQMDLVIDRIRATHNIRDN